MRVEETGKRPGISIAMDWSGTARRFGMWIAPATLLATPVAMQREQAARIERLGYGSLWTGEPPSSSPAGGREIFAELAVVLAATERLVAGAGIANISRRHPAATHGAAATLAEAYPGRLVLGLGGHSGDRPLTAMREYLDAMDQAAKQILPQIRYPRVLAALGPKSHRLAAERTDGVHPFLQPVEHTEIARNALGPDALLIPHQALVLDENPDSARGSMRALLARGWRNVETPYTRNYRRLGYGDDDLADDRSDRLIDATLAWGDERAVAHRLRRHLDAGADHVLLHPLSSDLPSAVDVLERLAPRLLN
jgi:probable F420-dependent oxidoreductase